jgi:hypothetical protein
MQRQDTSGENAEYLVEQIRLIGKTCTEVSVSEAFEIWQKSNFR